MGSERPQRRLAAVFAADVVGYSRLMEADETGTLMRLKSLRADILDPTIADHGGRIVKTTGDGMLVEFVSAVDAFVCAVAVQTELAAQTTANVAARPLEIRIGLHLGDILPDDGDIFGSGVNIAARLEALAPAGGIALSSSIQEQIAGKADAKLVEAGPKTVKNISRPIDVWMWHPDGVFDVDQATSTASGPAPTSSKKPVLMVLPFTASGQGAEELSESLADELTTAFSLRRSIDVVGRSVATQPEPSMDSGQSLVAATNADYIITGAIRRSGERLRVTAELIETETEAQLWSDRYDLPWGDLFSLVDELTERIAIAARTPMNAFEGRRYAKTPERRLNNDERRAKAAQHFYKFTKRDFDAAETLLEEALEDDAEDAMALAMLGFCIMYKANFDARRVDKAKRQRAIDLADRAVQLDRNSDYARYVHGLLALHLRADSETALEGAEQALILNPQYGLAHHLKAEALIYCGRPEEGIPILQKLIDVDPRDPVNYLRYWTLAMGFLVTEQNAKALTAIRHASQGIMAIPTLDLANAAILALQDKLAEARKAMSAFRDRWPELTIDTCKLPPFRDDGIRSRFRAALVTAGLPSSAHRTDRSP